MVGQGRMPKQPLQSITFYVDWMNFEQLPFQGGTADQPADVMLELRYIHAVVAEERRKKQAQQNQSRKRQRQAIGG